MPAACETAWHWREVRAQSSLSSLLALPVGLRWPGRRACVAFGSVGYERLLLPCRNNDRAFCVAATVVVWLVARKSTGAGCACHSGRTGSSVCRSPAGTMSVRSAAARALSCLVCVGSCSAVVCLRTG
jgi:hypothetical protein